METVTGSCTRRNWVCFFFFSLFTVARVQEQSQWFLSNPFGYNHTGEIHVSPQLTTYAHLSEFHAWPQTHIKSTQTCDCAPTQTAPSCHPHSSRSSRFSLDAVKMSKHTLPRARGTSGGMHRHRLAWEFAGTDTPKNNMLYKNFSNNTLNKYIILYLLVCIPVNCQACFGPHTVGLSPCGICHDSYGKIKVVDP